MSRLRGLGLLFKVGGDGVPGLMRHQGGPQERQLPVCLEAPETLGGLQHGGGGPAERHLGIVPSFDVAADAADGAVHVLADVGAGERTAQPGRKAGAVWAVVPDGRTELLMETALTWSRTLFTP